MATIPSNMILIAQDILQSCPDVISRHKYYMAMTSADITGDARRLLGDELRGYLDRYFKSWKLRRQVEEKPRSDGPYKEVSYALVFDTDADAETVKSRLRKGDMQLPTLAWLRTL